MLFALRGLIMYLNEQIDTVSSILKWILKVLNKSDGEKRKKEKKKKKLPFVVKQVNIERYNMTYEVQHHQCNGTIDHFTVVFYFLKKLAHPP